MISTELRHLLEQKLSIEILSSRRVSGGDINEAFAVTDRTGHPYFVKGNGIEDAWEMLSAESLGLQKIKASCSVPVPEIIDCGKQGHYAYLALEFIEPGIQVEGRWEDFAQNLVKMHESGELPFGLEHDNFIGRLHQRNRNHDTWEAFYRKERLVPQLDQMKTTFPGETQFYRDAEILLKKLDQITEDAEPSLIHGDMWSGNFLISSTGRIYLVDPAVSIASREMDIAMSRLFGGYPERFYVSYHHHYPLQPGWEERIPLYQLYYLLVHVNLFGRSYINGAHRAIRKYL